MGSSKKSKDKDKLRSREEKKKKRHRPGHGEVSKSKEKDKDKHRHRHHHKHKKHRSKRSRHDPSSSHPQRLRSPTRAQSQSPSLSDVTISDDDEEIVFFKERPLPAVDGLQSRLNFDAEEDDDDDEEGAIPSTPPPPPYVKAPTSPIHKSVSAPAPPNISGIQNLPSGGGSDASLSIEETNRIRMKLGLKPLQVSDMPKSEDRKESTSTAGTKVSVEGEEFYHTPAVNLRDKLQVDKLREKIAVQREKRRIRQKMAKVKTLGESEDEEGGGALAWVNKSRKMHKERLEAERKNKMLEELDAQLGIGDLVEEEMTHQKNKAYAQKNLIGLKVQHDMTRFADGRTTILTLKDNSILDGDEDTLVNVNIIDTEIVEKNLKRKRAKPDDKDYDAPEVDENGDIVQNTLLTKYDEEIQGVKMNSFRLGSRGQVIMNDGRDYGPMVNKVTKLQKLQSLELPQSQLATEYFTPTEMVSFRKVKKVKKKKKKKMLTADDLLSPQGGEYYEEQFNESVQSTNTSSLEVSNADPLQGGSGRLRSSSPGVNNNNSDGVKSLRELMEEEQEENVQMDIENSDDKDGSDDERDDIELQEALARSRRAKAYQNAKPSSEQISDFIKTVKTKNKIKIIAPVVPITMNDDDDEEDEDDINMTLNMTDEFCRTLGDIPTYGLSGNRAREDSTMLQLSPPTQTETNEARGAWEEVDIEDTRVEITDEIRQPILEEEPDASKGVGNALKLAVKKGYLEKGSSNKNSNAALQHLRAVHYSIEDKTVDDDRRGRGDRYMGPVTDFRDKELYKPDVKLEYVDDEGRKLNAKEAFRYLSHKFHGKGSGKNKLEKRMKKWHEELLMRHMSSSDTPLQTLERQREKQKQLGSAYLILSGNKQQESMDIKK